MGGKSPAALERGDHPKIDSAVGIVSCLVFICFFLKPAKESCCKCFCELVLDWDLRANPCPSVTVQKVLKASLIRKFCEALSWILWSVNFSSQLASILHKSLRQTETYVMTLSSGGKWVWESQLWLFGCSCSTEVAELTSSTLLFLTHSQTEQSHWFSFDLRLGLCPCPSQNSLWDVKGCVRWTWIFQGAFRCLPSRAGKMKSCHF